MGGLRAAVGVVLGVISLAVLSLHIALCIHYPSPLFAVTLLLNPSLWLFLGLIGMGCALLLTHRDQQRKVRAGHCTSCHPHYGSTVDTKWRAQDPKWRGGGMHCQRGPSRAIYSYNGNLHKFYASYGAINEKQLIEMKHATLKSPNGSNVNDKISNCPPGETNDTQGDETGVQKDLGSLCDGEKIQSEDANNTGSRVSAQVEGKDAGQNESPSSCVDSRKSEEIGAERENQHEKGQANNPTDTATANAPNIPPPSPHEMYYRERRYCDCMARYGAIYQYSQLPRSAMSPRCNRYAMQDRSVSRYNSKLLMRCKLKPPNDVPVELFAAKGVSSDKVSTEADKEVDSDVKKSEDGTRDSVNENQEAGSNSPCPSQKVSQVSEEEVSSVGCTTDSTSLSSVAELSAPRESVKQTPRSTLSSSFIVPLKHMPRFSTQTSTSLPLGSPYNGKSKHTDYGEDHESTSLSSDHTASEQDFQDQDVVSISSKSSLLPSSPEKSITNRDLTRSPLWRPFKSSIIGRKRLSDEDRNSNEDISKNHHSKGYSTGNDSTNEDSQESPSSTLKSVFTNKKSFTKSGADNRKTSTLDQSNSNENISSGSTSSSASPAMKEKRRQQVDTSRPTKSKSSLSRKISAAKAQSLQKNSKTLLLSPAKAVRSLVFRNAQKRSGRVRKLPDEKTQQGDHTPAKLPLLSSPNTEPIPIESSITTHKAEHAESAKKNVTSVTDASIISQAASALEAASTFCSTSPIPSSNSNAVSMAGPKVSNHSSAVTWAFSQADSSAKELHSSTSAQETSNRFTANEPTVKTPLLSSPATSSTSPAVATPPVTTMASSSSPCGSPSVRPKEPKKPKIRLKGKHRPRPTESILLLTADSDE